MVTTKTFDCYRDYVALKRHFSSDYDYFKYRGKIRLSPESLEKRRDRYYFEKLAQRPDYRSFFVSNLSANPDVWIGDLVNSPDAERVHRDWLRRQQSITRVFEQDLDKLRDDFNSNFVPEDGQAPHVVSLYQAREITPETLVILDDATSFMDRVKHKVVDTILWPGINRHVNKYKPFVEFDRAKTMAVMRKRYLMNSKHAQT